MHLPSFYQTSSAILLLCGALCAPTNVRAQDCKKIDSAQFKARVTPFLKNTRWNFGTEIRPRYLGELQVQSLQRIKYADQSSAVATLIVAGKQGFDAPATVHNTVINLECYDGVWKIEKVLFENDSVKGGFDFTPAVKF